MGTARGVQTSGKYGAGPQEGYDRRVRLGATAGIAALALALVARAQETPIVVAVLDAPGVGQEALETAIAALGTDAGLEVRRVRPDEVRSGALEGAHAVLFTGGRGSVQGRALGQDGRAAVRRFVERGGGYVGICAGAYLALQGEPEFFKLGLVAGRHATGEAWVRGIAPVRIRSSAGTFEAHYANGPLVAPQEVPGVAPFVVLSTFETELASEAHGTHRGEMAGMPAVLAAARGRGRIVLFSPNPTLPPAHPEWLRAALLFAAHGGALREDLGWADVFGDR